MSDFWTIKTGSTIASVTEETTVSVGLPLVPNTNPTIKLISGELPPGMRIKNYQIIGTPLQVERTKTFSFVLRATVGDNIEDRTYRIIVNGPDAPEWHTPEGYLKVGGDNPANNRYFILDNEPIEFQLDARDVDLPTGKNLEFYIDKDDGVLPPGISMSKTGKITGIVEPLLALDKASNIGHYDSANYDMYLHDFSNRASLFYQGQIIPNYVFNPPKKLNRFYEFKVSVTDGYDVVKRNFIIYVVGEDFLRADNVVIQVGTGIFTADNTFIRWPVWITPPDLGFRRANNYITLFLDVLKNENQLGAIVYELLSTNDDNSVSQVPPGMTLDTNTGEIAGRVGYQPAITRTYKFTVRAKLIVSENNIISVADRGTAYRDRTFTVRLLGEVDSKITWLSKTNLGTIPANFGSVFRVEAETTVPDAPLIYTYVSGRLPPGLNLEYNGEITGKVVQFGDSEKDGLTIFDNDNMTFDGDTTSTDRIYKFVVEAKDRFGYSASQKEFSIEVIDDDDTQYSNLYMKPFLKEDKRDRFSQFISDPINFPSSVIYRPNDPNFGLQREIKILAYAGIETRTVEEVFAKSQKYHKKRRYRVGEIKSAVAKTPGTQDIVYEVIYLEVLDPAKPLQGTARESFVQRNPMQVKVDSQNYDTNRKYTTQNDGVPTLNASGSSDNRNNEQYRFQTNDTQLDLGDTVLSEDGSTILTATANTDSEPFKFGPRNAPTADSDAFLASGGGGKKYISNIDNMQNSIKSLGRTEYDFLPLWMRTPQDAGMQEPGFMLAIPLCYVKPGNSASVLLTLKNNAYDLKDLDLEIDRYIVDSTTGKSGDQYILFENFEYNA